MTAIVRHVRPGAVALAALVALALPASAAAGPKSQVLKLYKVERHVDIEGEDGTYPVTCPNGDLALDGMWRVDDVEQDNDFGGSLIDLNHTLRPVQARSTADDTFEFRFTPLSGGNVQIKLFVTCLGKSVGGHSWAFSQVAPFTDSSVDTTIATPVTTAQASCSTPGQIVAAPGFEVTAGSDTYYDLTRSTPSANATQWDWEWFNYSTGADGIKVTHSWRCLTLKSSAAGSPPHAHRIVRNRVSRTGTIPAGTIREVQASCGEHYKGMIGGWDLRTQTSAGPPPTYAGYLWYLGMDPRIKSRAFKLANPTATPRDGTGYLVCFKDKTT